MGKETQGDRVSALWSVCLSICSPFFLCLWPLLILYSLWLPAWQCVALDRPRPPTIPRLLCDMKVTVQIVGGGKQLVPTSLGHVRMPQDGVLDKSRPAVACPGP